MTDQVGRGRWSTCSWYISLQEKKTER